MQAGAASTKLKFKREPSRRRSHTRRIHNASGDGPNKIEIQTQISAKTVAHAPHSLCKRCQKIRNPNTNQSEDGRTRAAFTMQAVAAPTKLKPRRESARRRSHTRRIHNASDGGPNKIETRTHISPKTVADAPHLQCKRWRPQEN